MAITIVGTEFGYAVTSGVNITVNKPSGTASGDILYAIQISKTGSSRWYNVPSGSWATLLTASGNVDSAPSYLRVYRLVAGASEPSSYTFPYNALYADGAIAIVSVRGADYSTESVTSDINGASGSATSPSITVASSGSLVLRAGVNSRANFALTSVTDATALARYNSGGTTNSIDIYQDFDVPSGSTGTKSAPYTPDWHSNIGHIVVAVGPASSGGSVLPVFRHHFTEQGIG